MHLPVVSWVAEIDNRYLSAKMMFTHFKSTQLLIILYEAQLSVTSEENGSVCLA